MPSKTRNTQAGEEQESRAPDKSNARDREGRKGGDNAKNL